MVSVLTGNVGNSTILCETRLTSLVGNTSLPLLQYRARLLGGSVRGKVMTHSFYGKSISYFKEIRLGRKLPNREISTSPMCSTSPNSSGSGDVSDQSKTPFGYSRKDVLLIGLGVTVIGIGLKSGLEFAGVDPLQAGNVVQLVLVLGLTLGWISTYIFRVSNKEMTYAQQLRDYENQVMKKRLEGLTEAELESLLEQVEEEKRRLGSGEQIK